LIAPLQVAYFRYGKNIYAIPSDDQSLLMALDMLPSLMVQKSTNGAVFYSPKNTMSGGWDHGYTVSTENNISLLAGLKMLRYILSTRGFHLDKLADINTLINAVEAYIKDSFSPQLGYFRQGGHYDINSRNFIWAEGSTIFSVDCQTWAMSVISPLLIDQWFGPGSAHKIWEVTKTLGGYSCNPATKLCKGVGYSNNQQDQVFSGEWTLGAVNMLRIFAVEYNNDAYRTEALFMRQAIEDELIGTATIDNFPVTGVKYSNKRYYIPFGWWANPLLSTASTGWTVLADNDFNPFHWGGAYKVNY